MIRYSAELTWSWALNQRSTRRSWLLRTLLVLFWVGRTNSFFVFVSLVSLTLALTLLPNVRDLDALPGKLVAVLNALGVIAAWAVLHTTYGLYYAYLYYRSEESSSGLAFPAIRSQASSTSPTPPSPSL